MRSAISTESSAPSRLKAKAALWPAAGILLAAILFGGWLRLGSLSGQTPFHDEWHALVAVDQWNFRELASHFGTADHSIPVAWWLELSTRIGGLSDLSLWLPGVIGSCAAAAMLARAVSPTLLSSASLFFLGLLSLSPLHVYFARSARPYAWSSLLAVLAALWIDRWLVGGRRIDLARWLGAAVLATWATPVFVPFVVGPVLALGVRELQRSEERRPIRRRAAIAVASLGLMLSVAFAAALLLDTATLRAKSFRVFPPPAEGLRALELALGGFPAAIALALAAAAVLGFVEWRSRDPRLAAAVLAASAAQLVAVAIVRPAGIASPFVLGRYLLPLGVIGLLFAASGVEIAMERLIRRAAPIGVAAVALIVGIATWLPRTDLVLTSPDNFRSTRLYHLLFFTPEFLRDAFPTLPVEYQPIRDAPGRFAILELPYNGYLRTPYPYYQLAHRREIYLGVEKGWCSEGDTRELPPAGERGFRLSRFVEPGSLDQLRSRSIRFVVLHRDPEGEVPWVRRETRRRDRFEFDACVERLREATKIEPARSDRIAVFDLAALAE